jgi:hypothetical protein
MKAGRGTKSRQNSAVNSRKLQVIDHEAHNLDGRCAGSGFVRLKSQVIGRTAFSGNR